MELNSTLERKHSLQAHCALILALGLLLSASAWAQRSELSHWLDDDALPQLADVLSAHPRFAGESVQVIASGQTGLDEALVTVLVGNLGSHEGVAIGTPSAEVSPRDSTIDALACGAAPRHATLRVSTRPADNGRGRVTLELADAEQPDATWRRWEWQGIYSREERAALARAAAPALADGSLVAPWPQEAVSRAAAALARDLACDMRSQVRDRIALQWDDTGLPTERVGDVFNASRHLLGDLREVDVQARGEFRIEPRVERFSDGVLQLWLVGTPQRAGFSTVQAVTYMRDAGVDHGGEEVLAGTAPVQVPPSSLHPVRAVALQPPASPARDFLDVRMLDVSQADGGFSSADLALQLRLENRGAWPIEYAFSVSGGHFLHCVAEPDNFRHDRYGYVEGEIAPGASLVRMLEVRGVKHKPNPWFGPRKCAGFKDLEGFENFPGKGYKVTEFLRWDL